MAKAARTANKMMDGYHKSVLLNEIIDALKVAKDKWYLDATLGDGGHSLEILKRHGKVLGVDADPQALERARKRLEDAGFGNKDFKLIQGNFRDIKNLINTQAELAQIKFAGCIFDLGVSSLQLEASERGFSFGKNGPLDMRMDPTLQIRAWDLVNNLKRKELYEIFKDYGEEKYAWNLATTIERTRQVKPFETTVELASVAEKVLGRKKDQIHPATKIFQALRIVVNDELNALKEGLEAVLDSLDYDAVICIISFHSLEDRIVKLTFRDWEFKGLGQVLTDKPILPSESEITENPRSRSAKLRIFKRYDYSKNF